jgi:phosphopantothenoylcysteine decarboxylase
MSKNILLGISGSIAAYKAADIASKLIKANFSVKVVMTKNATEFITPLTFQTLTGNEVYIEEFAPIKNYDVEHISLVKWADLAIIAPASANIMAKITHGLADDMLSTTMLSFPQDKPRLIAPAMNTRMYENFATQSNMKVLKERGYEIIEPREARLACGDVGKGAMQEVDVIVARIKELL